jgi:hypothetical protein
VESWIRIVAALSEGITALDRKGEMGVAKLLVKRVFLKDSGVSMWLVWHCGIHL